MEPIKSFQITSLTLEGFKCFDKPTHFAFGSMNIIHGHNGQGKTSIADAIAFAITGVPFFGGTRLDRLYHGDDKSLHVTMELTDQDGAGHQICRQRVNDRVDISFDGAPTTQTILDGIFGERDIFLSAFNPLYFINVLGNDGRNLMERYLPAIPHEEIMAKVSDNTREKLKGQNFLSGEAFLKELREEATALERDITYLEGQRDLAKAQADSVRMELIAKKAEHEKMSARIAELDTRRTTGFDGASLEDRRADLYARFEELSREPDSPGYDDALTQELRQTVQRLESRRAEAYVPKYAQAAEKLQIDIGTLRAEAIRLKKVLEGLTPGIQCPYCKQTVTEATLPQVRREFEENMSAVCVEGQALVGQLKELNENEQKARKVFEAYQTHDVAALEASCAALQQKLVELRTSAEQANSQRKAELEKVRSDIQAVEFDLEAGCLGEDERMELALLREQEPTLAAEIIVFQTQEALGEAQDKDDEIASRTQRIKEVKELITAVTFYIAKRVELVLSKLKMNRVAIQLYEVLKSTGTVKDVFKFTYEERPFTSLSTSEQIRAGLEVAELIKGLTGRNYPVFIDNGESVPVIDNIRPTGQIMTAQVVKGAALEVFILDAPAAGKAA